MGGILIGRAKIINILKNKLTVMLVIFIVTLFLIMINSIINVKAENIVYNYAYTGNYQTFTAPSDGTYKVQLWSAQGGSSREDNVISTARVGGYGAYTAGMIELKKDKYYISM